MRPLDLYTAYLIHWSDGKESINNKIFYNDINYLYNFTLNIVIKHLSMSCKKLEQRIKKIQLLYKYFN